MNKIAKSLCMMAVVALAFTSCKKNQTDTQSIKFNGTTQQFEVLNDGDDFEKVYLDGNNTVQFEEGERIQLFNVMSPEGTGSNAVLYELDANMILQQIEGYGEIGSQTSGNYYAFYPGENVKRLNMSNENRAKFRLDAVQNDRRDDAGNVMIPMKALYMAAKDMTHTNLADAYYDFKNICGMLSLKFYSPSGKTVKSIEVTDNHFNLVGDVTLKIHEVDPVYMTTLFRNYDENNSTYMAELQDYLSADRLGYMLDGDISRTLKLDCGNGVQLGTTKAEATRFFLVMRPLALLKGCTIKITFTDDTYKEITSTKNNMISPNVIRNISAVNVD